MSGRQIFSPSLWGIFLFWTSLPMQCIKFFLIQSHLLTFAPTGLANGDRPQSQHHKVLNLYPSYNLWLHGYGLISTSLIHLNLTFVHFKPCCKKINPEKNTEISTKYSINFTNYKTRTIVLRVWFFVCFGNTW